MAHQRNSLALAKFCLLRIRILGEDPYTVILIRKVYKSSDLVDTIVDVLD